MKLKLSSTNEVIELPTHKQNEYGQLILDDEEKTIPYTPEDRLAYVNEILEKYPQEFLYGKKMFGMKYGIRQDNNSVVKTKLDILATYLIRGDDSYKKEKDVMSRYKEEKRPLQEMAFSQFNPDLVDINGWH